MHNLDDTYANLRSWWQNTTLMHFSKAILSVLLVILLWLSLGFSSVQAQSVEDLQNYQQQVEQQRQILQKQQEQIQTLSKPAQDRLEALRKNVKATDEQINENISKIKQAKVTLNQLQTKLQDLELALNRKRLSTTMRLRYLQKQQVGKWWAVLLSSQDLNQLVNRRRQISRIYESDRKLLASLKASTDKIESQHNAIATQKNEIDLLNQKLVHQKANYEAEALAQANVVERLKSDHRSLEQAEDRLAQDSRQITALILAKAQPAAGIILVPGTGQMMYPVIAPITSQFGWRTHPILGYSKFHSGMDFGADYGTLISATDNGTVIFAGWYGGYGNAVIIGHGNDITTLYGHTSEMFVSEGQNVQKGQPIAVVGSTGFSTGPHLHFEVRASGEPVDPAQFL